MIFSFFQLKLVSIIERRPEGFPPISTQVPAAPNWRRLDTRVFALNGDGAPPWTGDIAKEDEQRFYTELAGIPPLPHTWDVSFRPGRKDALFSLKAI